MLLLLVVLLCFAVEFGEPCAQCAVLPLLALLLVVVSLLLRYT
jgi:hypothetical protein